MGPILYFTWLGSITFLFIPNTVVVQKIGRLHNKKLNVIMIYNSIKTFLDVINNLLNIRQNMVENIVWNL